jgi:hypothetical protein
LLKRCSKCGVNKLSTDFYRRRTQGYVRKDGTKKKYLNRDNRRGVCKSCEKSLYPQKKKSPGEPRKQYTLRCPTVSGIREKLLGLGIVPGTKEWKRLYFKEYAKLGRADGPRNTDHWTKEKILRDLRRARPPVYYSM